MNVREKLSQNMGKKLNNLMHTMRKPSKPSTKAKPVANKEI